MKRFTRAILIVIFIIASLGMAVAFGEPAIAASAEISTNCKGISIKSEDLDDGCSIALTSYLQSGKMENLVITSWAGPEMLVTDFPITDNTYSLGVYIVTGQFEPVAASFKDNKGNGWFGHVWVDATCTEVKTCSVCGTTEGELAAHNLVNGKCKDCDYSLVTSITISESSLSLGCGANHTLTATILPADLQDVKAIWSSSDENVVTVSPEGLVTAIGAGTATITAEAGGKTTECAISVSTYMMVVNTLTDTSSQTEGSFSSESETGLLQLLTQNISAQAESDEPEIVDRYIDDDGNEMTVVKATFTDIPVSSSRATVSDVLADTQETTSYFTGSYEVGSTVYIYDNNNNYRKMACVAVGEHCTVWGTTKRDGTLYQLYDRLDNENTRITTDVAIKIAESFDSNYDKVVGSFGTWADVDKDGKLAILCYDIDSNYGKSVSTYTAGFFRMADLVTSDQTINGTESSDHSYIGMGVDCIHIDTYPGMSKSKKDVFGNYTRCYSTLVHEFQHLINFSYQVANGTENYYSDMEVYLNEAFSMAAEHLVCGSSSTKTRITYFNGSSYVPGNSITVWSSGDTLSKYSTSYLLGQYFRTRYGQLMGNDGNEFFKTVLLARQSNKGGDTLQLIADIFSTTKEQLIIDFWTAVFLRQNTGIYGFNGENWADEISPVVSDLSSNGAIYNGGCKYYVTTAASEDAYTVKNNVEIKIFK